MFLSFTQGLPHGHPDVDNRAFPPLEFEGLVAIQAPQLPLTVFTLSLFPQGNPSRLQVPVQGPPAMVSTEGEKDLNQGRAHNEKTDTSNLQAGDQGTLLLSMAGSQDVSFQPILLWAEVMRSLGKSYTGEFDQHTIKRE